MPTEQQGHSSIGEHLVALNHAATIPPDYVFPITHGADDNIVAGNHHGLKSDSVAGTNIPPENQPKVTEISSDNTHCLQPKHQARTSEKCSPPAHVLVTRPLVASKAKLESDPTEIVGTATGPNQNAPMPTTQSCAACGDDVLHKDLMHLSCDHSYCNTCAAELVKLALRMNGTFPPSCCKGLPITLGDIDGHVPLGLVQLYQKEQDRIAKASSLCCANRKCKTLIPAGEIDGLKGHCKVCLWNTCRICKGKCDEGHSCNERKERERLAKLAKENGWQTCYKCRTVVEISFGCNHMRFVTQASGFDAWLT